ncbi:MAG: hypothetical protein SFZ03_02915 [Candidatus Melainabacteria bacterium]|nr:hypothetical protein [Candidatus Melainabacteria bacterium]
MISGACCNAYLKPSPTTHSPLELRFRASLAAALPLESATASPPVAQVSTAPPVSDAAKQTETNEIPAQALKSSFIQGMVKTVVDRLIRVVAEWVMALDPAHPFRERLLLRLSEASPAVKQPLLQALTQQTSPTMPDETRLKWEPLLHALRESPAEQTTAKPLTATFA